MKLGYCCTLAVGLFSLSAWAGPPLNISPADQKALTDTQQTLTDPAKRQKALDTDPRAKAVDAAARQAVGDANTADVYALAADMMGSLTEEAGGDPQKMMELLQQAQKNPEILEQKLTPEQRAKLKAISERMPASAADPGQKLK
jgi:hypothetical protein